MDNNTKIKTNKYSYIDSEENQSSIKTPGFNQFKSPFSDKRSLSRNEFAETIEILRSSPVCNDTPMDIASILVEIKELLAYFSIPEISENEKDKLIEYHKQWGELGWTYFPSAPVYFFNTPPIDTVTANSLMDSLCSKDEMILLFKELRSHKIKKEDLESSIFCFEKKQYKACSSLLFGIIESKLIRIQDSSKFRLVDNRAVKHLKEKFSDSEKKKVAFSMLFCENLFACLDKFFEYGNNFKKEPQNINRNYICHGMNTRSVRKRDCIQLFLLLNNLMYLLE